MLPDRLPPAAALPALVAARGPRRARVALLAGCVQQTLDPEVTHATVRVLAANGVEVAVPRLIRAFPTDVDAIVTNAAGCGSAMKEYGDVLTGTADESDARAFASRVRDVSEFLHALGLVDPPALREPRTVAYHDACHLAHAQGIRTPPRALLARVANLRVLEIADGEVCCGSAGLYNVEQPAIAGDLGRRKAQAILATGADMVAAGNIGCMVQIATHMARAGAPRRVLHTMQVLDEAYRLGAID